MEVPFDVDIDLDEDNNHSNDGCELHNDYDNQKLFDVFESYLNKSDISDTESEPELSMNDEFYQLVTNKRVAKTPVINRSIRRISCFKDIENSISRKVLSDNQLNQSLDESMSESMLPWNLNDMNEQQIVDLVNKLDEELIHKEDNYPEMAAKAMKSVFDQQIQFLNDVIQDSEQKFKNNLQEIGVKSTKERVVFDELIDKELKEIKTKSDKMSKLLTDLEVIQKISNK